MSVNKPDFDELDSEDHDSSLAGTEWITNRQILAANSDTKRVDAETKIGRYEVIRRLGGGGFGFVYLASDPDLHRNVAVKVPRWDRPLTEGLIRQFLQEGKMLAQVRHPSIVGVHDVGTTKDGMPFVVMEFIEGRPLSQVIKTDSLSLDDKVTLLLKIATGLQAAHKNGLVHRDLKPANVIVDVENEIHLVDFGLALHDELSVEEWESNAVAGTPHFMAPEQIRGENHLIDGQTDIWAFGVTMYAMLVGALPFRFKVYRDLVRSICYKNPKPLRQLDENIPRQLERICLRCLQKLMDDRYQSMADLIEELRAFQHDQHQNEHQAGSLARPSLQALEYSQASTDSARVRSETDAATGGQDSKPSEPSSPLSNTVTTTGSRSSSPLTIVPKGLRPFDQNDKEFFLGLLPGPTDRLGTPESIRFWTSRLGLIDQVDDIPVGVIYGPSGSGKSSFVRAGLIPKLPENVIDLYIDCTTERLENYISGQMRRVFGEIPEGESLSRTLRLIRNGQYVRPGDKLLIVLDQFEQWLTNTRNPEEAELTEALRQCASERVQALILIRDEFWLSTSQYLHFLGQRIEEHRNAMPLPLFDIRHARSVLTAIGRAYGLLPVETETLAKPQIQFISEAVDSIADHERVICVHLTVFAEATKNSEWDVKHFRAKGGLDGIGRDYVTGIFTNPETPAFIKRHSHEAWGVLKQLLPVTSTKLKGVGVERQALLRDSEVPMSQSCFDGLMKFLEFDCNLISRVETDAEDESLNIESKQDSKYSLTHDFLVKPIRAWGEAKQNETRIGRARSDFSKLAEQWTLTRDRRFMPSLWDFCRFYLFADLATKNQHPEFWKKSGQTALVRSITGVASLSLIAALTYGSWGANRARMVSEFNEYLVCIPEEFDSRLAKVLPNLDSINPQLRNATNHENPNVRFRAFCSMLCADPNNQEMLRRVVEELSLVDFDECRTLYSVTRRNQDLLVPEWTGKCNQLLVAGNADDVSKGEEASSEQKQKFRAAARLAIPLAYLGSPEPLAKLMSASANPLARTIAFTELPHWHLRFDQLLENLDLKSSDKENGALLSGVFCGIGLNATQIQGAERDAVAAKLLHAYSVNNHGGAHYAAWYALNQLGTTIPDISDTKDPDRQWRTLKLKLDDGSELKLDMVRIEPGRIVVGDGDPMVNREFGLLKPLAPVGTSIEIKNSFWISNVALSNLACRKILESAARTSDGANTMYELLVKELAKKGSDLNAINDWQSQVSVSCSFPGAAEIANSVSNLLGLKPFYNNLDFPEKIERTDGGGFRLPLEFELEHATRCGSQSKYHIGNDDALAEKLMGKQGALDGRRLEQFPPNANGLFGCGVYADRLDLVRETNGGEGWAALFRGGFSSPASSADLGILGYKYRLASFRLVIDDEIINIPKAGKASE